jgi:hypothetical protein
MSSKYPLVVIIITLAILLTALPKAPVQADVTVEFEFIELNPDPIVVGEEFEVRAKLVDEANVTGLFLNICTEFVCLPPLELTRGTDGVYTLETDTIDTVELFHYNITVRFDDSTLFQTDDVYFTPITTDLDVTSIGHDPVAPKVGQKMMVTVELASDENVTNVALFHCKDDVCFTPIEMTLVSGMIYEAEIGPFNSVAQIKYNVTVYYDDGSKQWQAWTANETFMLEKKAGNGDDDNGFIPAVGAVAAIAILAGLGVTRRGRKS